MNGREGSDAAVRASGLCRRHALTGALNAVDEPLKPRVFCVPNLRNRGAGCPAMGRFVEARGNAP